MENETQITVTDLALLRSIVEVASSRGAFKADELTTVGQLYDKLNAFLNELLAQAEQEENPVESAESTEVVESVETDETDEHQLGKSND